jgi:hypothetical protein
MGPDLEFLDQVIQNPIYRDVSDVISTFLNFLTSFETRFPEFEALSYSWSIGVLGCLAIQRLLVVTWSKTPKIWTLHYEHLRYAIQSRRTWIDAICIN